MPYKIYKKNGYKVCKPGGKKCFSKKGLSKEKAEAQQKALYASEQTNEALNMRSAGKLEFVAVYPSTDEASVVYKVKKEPYVNVTLVYTLRDSFYPEYEYFVIKDKNDPKGTSKTSEDPQSEEAVALLKTYGLTPDDIEMAGQDAPDKIHDHWEKESSQESFEESLAFEKLFAKIFANEKE
jgi:hypothetical protein